MRNLGGGVGISVAITLLERRAQLHVDRLALHTTMLDPIFRARTAAMAHTFMHHGAGPAQAHTQAMALMFSTVQQQASMLSYLDVFKVMAVGCIPVVILTLFLKKIRHGSSAPSGAH
jgi:DHA2 family multidrug resistance protein